MDKTSENPEINVLQLKAYSIEAFCKTFSVGKTLTYAEIKAGRLKIAKIGRRTVIPADAADVWFKQKCQ